MAIASEDQLTEFNNRIRNGHTGSKYLTKNNIYVGSDADDATQATTDQLNEYYNRVRNGHSGQNYLTKNNIYIGNRDTSTTATDDSTNGMSEEYYNMVYGYDVPTQDTSYMDTYRNDMSNIDYGDATTLDDSWYNTYADTLSNINGLANLDTLYDWRKNEATDTAKAYMASLGLSGSGAEAQAVSDAVNQVTSEDAQRYEQLYQQEAQRQTDAANQLAQLGYNLSNSNANYANDLNTLKVANQSELANNLAQYGYNNAYNTQQLQAQKLANDASNYRGDTQYQTNREDEANQNNINNLLSKLSLLINSTQTGVTNSSELTKVLSELKAQMGSLVS